MLGPFVSMSLSPTDGKDNLTKRILSFSNPITINGIRDIPIRTLSLPDPFSVDCIDDVPIRTLSLSDPLSIDSVHNVPIGILSSTSIHQCCKRCLHKDSVPSLPKFRRICSYSDMICVLLYGKDSEKLR